MLSGNSATFTCSYQASSNGRNLSLIVTSSLVFTSPDKKLITAATAGITVNKKVGGVRIYTITSVKPSQAGKYVCSVGGISSSVVLYVQGKVYLSYHNVSHNNIANKILQCENSISHILK